MSQALLIRNRRRGMSVNTRRLRQFTAGLLEELQQTDFELAIHLLGAAESARLNEKHLRHKGPTDVITFDYRFGVPGFGVPRFGVPPSGGPGGVRRADRVNAELQTPDRLKAELRTLRGELFICLDEAVVQAREFRTTWQSELARYVIHGVLHLLGHDDSKPAARRRMKREENRLLKEMGRRFPLRQLGGRS